MSETTIKLDDEAIRTRLSELADWKINHGELQRLFSLPTFPAAIFFVNAVAHIAELGAHHPDIFISYNKVTLSFVTHSAGGLTDKDFAMAHKVDELWTVVNWTPGTPLAG
jgi:4a-hydroxytetrahydrobiopterin dehydratase